MLPWSLSGSLKNCLGLCYYPAEDICPHPAHKVHSPSPLCHHLTSSSLGLALLWSLVRKWIAVTLSTPEGRSASESGNLNPGCSLQKQAGVSQREVCCWCLLQCVEETQGWPDKDGRTASNSDPVFTS